MKKILLGATAALFMTGCAQNELLDGGIATPNDGKIYFSATSGVPTNTRAANGNPINSTADLQKIGSFKVVGYHNGTDEYVGSAATPVTVTWKNNTSWEYSNEPYWPSSGDMNFLAYANWGTGTVNIPLPTITGAGMTSTVIIAEDATTAHTDLLVAATYNATKEVRTLLTFKHALTQIVFKAANLSEATQADALDVHIGGIKIVNVSEKGTMTVSKNTTDDKAQIVWSAQDAQTAQRADYKVEHIDTDANPDKADGSFEVPRVAPVDQTKYSKYPRVQNAAESANNALMLVPQTFTAWDSNKGVKATDATQYGAYIEIDAIIRREGSTKQSEWFCGTFNTDIDGSSYGKIYIPVSSLLTEIAQWEAGKRINYIITFGDKNSGSGGGGYDENGDPILVPIKFRAVVEDWVETNVPLLTATFEATSSAITNKFITGYINQMLADVKDAAAPKVINANININGTVSNEIGSAPDYASLSVSHDFLTLANNQIYSSKFRPGSKVTYDLVGVSTATGWNGKTTTLAVPAGWEARTYLNTAPVNPANVTDAAIAAGAGAALSATADKIVLTKIPTSYAVYNSHVDYIEDNIGGVVLNEKSLAADFNTIIYVAGAIKSTNAAFSSDMLTELAATPNGATLAVNMTSATIDWATGGDKSITTWCPAGWKAEVVQTTGNTVTYFPGDPIVINKETDIKTIVFIKASISTHNYVGLEILKDWLVSTNSKADAEVFYYNNVDFDVEIKADSAPWTTVNGVAANKTIVVKLKYPLSASKVTGTQANNTTIGWTYVAGTGTLTYTDVNP